MRILAIDGANSIAVVACRSGTDGSVNFLASVARKGSAEADLLPSRVGACLASAGWVVGDLDVIACSVGPGGFTSIRVAVALTRGLAIAGGRPVMAVSSFEAIACRARLQGIQGPLRIVIPGGRTSWFVQDMNSGHQFLPPTVLTEPPQAIAGGTMVGWGGGAMLEVVADATDVARVAAARLASGERPEDGTSLLPLYLRGADAREGAGQSLLQEGGLEPKAGLEVAGS